VIATQEELAEIRRHAEADYPSECCGVILARDAERVLMRCRNVQDLQHARDPERYPRTSRTAYLIDSKDLLEIYKKCDVDGYRVAVIYHSHGDADAYFSETDKRNALTNDEPNYPEAIYVVVSVMHRWLLPSWLARWLPRWCLRPGRTAAVGAFRWNPEKRDFLPVEFKELEA
jgi:proteasome lid subunit RPN8/RPN11